jgi:hypothetical protein
MMFVAKPTHKAAARNDDFMFVVIEARQGEDTRLFVLADDAPRRLVAPQPFREVEWTFSSILREARSKCDASFHRFDGLQPRQFARR